MAELHESTWFRIEALPGITCTADGTLAGHPLADLVHALADAEIADMLHARLLDEGLIENLSCMEVPEFWGLQQDECEDFPVQCPINRPAYCDDAFLFFMGSAENLVTKVARAAAIQTKTPY